MSFLLDRGNLITFRGSYVYFFQGAHKQTYFARKVINNRKHTGKYHLVWLFGVHNIQELLWLSNRNKYFCVA